MTENTKAIQKPVYLLMEKKFNTQESSELEKRK